MSKSTEPKLSPRGRHCKEAHMQFFDTEKTREHTHTHTHSVGDGKRRDLPLSLSILDVCLDQSVSNNPFRVDFPLPVLKNDVLCEE
jgi:hypothetical protein